MPYATFTVTTSDYSDAPVSTISFDLVKRYECYCLDQTANAKGANLLVTGSINVSRMHDIA